jgi:hypothetical protein
MQLKLCIGKNASFLRRIKMSIGKVFHRGAFLGVALLALFIFGHAGVSNVHAQTGAPGVWGSAINIQNIGSQPANAISITFFDAAGAQITIYNVSEPLAAGGALAIFVPAIVTTLPPGQYSAVISSDQPLLASVNSASTNSPSAPWTAAAYEGFDSSDAGTSLYFPGNYKNYYNFYSEIVIQNAGNVTANLKGTFRDKNGTILAENLNLGQVAANASRTIKMADLAQLPSGNTNGLFGAVVTSDEQAPLVGVVNIWRSQPTSGTASYSGFTGGSLNLYAPALYKEYYGFGSALTIQNVHPTQNAAGTVTYSNGTTASFNLVPGAAQEFYQPANAALPSGNVNGVFAAKVEATSGSIVGLVSLSIPDGANGDFASYNVPNSASSTVNIPNVMSNYYGYFSAVTVQNTGNTPTNITITYPGGSNRVFNNVAGGASVNILHLDNAGDILPFRTSTSATVTSSNSNPLVAVIQHNTAPGVAGHNPAKRPSDFLLAISGSAD